MILEFYTHEAIPISKVMIFVGAFTAFMLNLGMKHPSRGTNSVDYNIAILIIPMLLFGTVVGVTLNKVAPSLLILSLLTKVLIINSFKTIRRAIRIFQSESEEKLLKEEDCKQKAETNVPVNPIRRNSNDKDSSSIELRQVNGDQNIQKPSLSDNLVRIELQKDKVILRWDKLKYMLYSYISIFILSLIKGSDHFDSIVGVQK